MEILIVYGIFWILIIALTWYLFEKINKTIILPVKFQTGKHLPFNYKKRMFFTITIEVIIFIIGYIMIVLLRNIVFLDNNIIIIIGSLIVGVIWSIMNVVLFRKKIKNYFINIVNKGYYSANSLKSNAIDNTSTTTYSNNSISSKIIINCKIGDLWKYFIDSSLFNQWYANKIRKIVPNYSNGATIYWKSGGESEIANLVEKQNIEFVSSSLITYFKIINISENKIELEIKKEPNYIYSWNDEGKSAMVEIKQELNTLKTIIESI